MKKLKTSDKNLISGFGCDVKDNEEATTLAATENKEGTDDSSIQFKREKKGKRRDRRPTSIIATETKVLEPSSVHEDVPSPEREMDVDEPFDSDSAQSEATKKPDRGAPSGVGESENSMRVSNGTPVVKLADQSIVRARVWELTPLLEQENHVLDVETTAEVTALVRFFYEHMFYPWDAEAEFCSFDESIVTDRHLLYRQMSGEVPGIPGAVAAEMRRTVRDAWLTFSAIDELEASCGVRRDGCEMAPGDVQRLILLHDKLDALKEHFEKLKNPVLRELSMQRNGELSMTHNSSGCDSLSCALAATVNRVWLVGRCASISLLQQLMDQLPGIVSKHYPQSVDWSVVLQPCLQPALDHSAGGDVVMLLPGTHLLSGLGALAVAGGAMHGIGKGVIIEGGLGAGDIMMHVEIENKAKTPPGGADLCLRNITLKPLSHQTALLVHGSALLLDRCSVRDCRAAITVVTEPSFVPVLEGVDDEANGRKGFCKMCDCHIADCSEVGVDVREHSAVEATNSTITNCHVGLRLHVGAKLDASGLAVSGSSRCAAEIVDVERGERDAEVKTLPGGERIEVLSRLHLANVCSSHEAVQLTDNFCDVATAASSSELDMNC